MMENSLAAFEIRRAAAADARRLAELGAKTFSETFAADNTPENMAAYLALSFGPGIQARELADPRSVFLIAEAGGAAAGYARLRFGPAPASIPGKEPAEIVRFYACKGWIGKGLGSQLMRACLDEAGRARCDVIWLDVWERNPRAIAFYRKWEFREAGGQIFRLGGGCSARPADGPAGANGPAIDPAAARAGVC